MYLFLMIGDGFVCISFYVCTYLSSNIVFPAKKETVRQQFVFYLVSNNWSARWELVEC